MDKMSVEQFIKYVDTSGTRTEAMRKFLIDGHGRIEDFNQLVRSSHISFNKSGVTKQSECYEKLDKWLAAIDAPEWYLSSIRIRELALIRTGILPSASTVRRGKELRHKTEVLTPEEVEQMIKAAELHPVSSSDIFGATQSNASEHISNADIFD